MTSRNAINSVSQATDTHRKAFSLVELSIVLVILGLLVGGILGGQSLIHAAELRSVSTEVKRFSTGVYSFRDKYFALPGDMKNATDFWGIAAGTTGNDTTCFNTPSTSQASCNGDGDGTIGGVGATYESFRIWQHLANAGLLEGSYTGVGNIIASDVHSVCVPGTNCPASKLGQGSYQVKIRTPMIDNPHNYDSAQVHLAFFGTSIGGTTNPTGAIITPEDAWNIDKKMDDGSPAYGKVRTFRKGSTATWAVETKDCANNTEEELAEYDFTRKSISCAMIFFLDF